MNYPILEYDPTPEALIEPSKVLKPRDVPEHCVVCFFEEVLEKVIAEYNAEIRADNHWEDGTHPLYEIKHQGQRVAFFHPGVGAALSAGLLESVIAFGCRKFIACGGCGVLVEDIAVGHLVVVSAAIRDEGVSYHYLPPGREVRANQVAVGALEKTLNGHDLPYHVGKTWTTDAPFRETPSKITRRREEGCITVEMEAAGMMAVSQFRGVVFGQLLYGGDNLSGAAWDNRNWGSKKTIRERLFWLCVEACLNLA